MIFSKVALFLLLNLVGGPSFMSKPLLLLELLQFLRDLTENPEIESATI